MTDDWESSSPRLRNLVLSDYMTQSAVRDIENGLRTRALLIRSTDPDKADYPVPVTALPSPVCLQDHREIENLQPLLNRVLDKLSLDKKRSRVLSGECLRRFRAKLLEDIQKSTGISPYKTDPVPQQTRLHVPLRRPRFLPPRL